MWKRVRPPVRYRCLPRESYICSFHSHFIMVSGALDCIGLSDFLIFEQVERNKLEEAGVLVTIFDLSLRSLRVEV